MIVVVGWKNDRPEFLSRSLTACNGSNRLTRMDEYGPDLPNTEPEEPVDIDDFLWEDPPLRGGSNSGLWQERLKRVMPQPGKWARVVECSGVRRAEMHCGNLRAGKIKVPSGQWEFQSRSDKTAGKSWVYARYLGPETSVREAETATPVSGSGTAHSGDSDLSSGGLREAESPTQTSESDDSGPETQDGGHGSFEEMVASEQTG